MLNYSNCIIDAMKYVDKKIDSLNPKSVDRIRLRNKINIQIVANIKRIAVLEYSDANREIDNIFNTQLLDEVSRHI